ncbi:transposase [Arenibacter palladensis]|uniref:REP-associated tyrosine transposase n=1 Tax=Arenibacter palladensis TaxID=237373 RepID=UPI002FD72D4B
MKEGYIIRDQDKAHFITTTVVDWIDAFTRKEYRDVVINSLNYCINNKHMLLYGYVIMSNHVHLIVQSKNGKLSDLIRDFKKFTARTILEKIMEEPESRKEWMLERFKNATKTHARNKNYQFWRFGNHAEEIYTEKFLWSKLDYIHLNPVRAGIVKKASEYLYSSASNYIDGKGILENIELATNPVIDVLRTSPFLKYE